jgi:hypothetical protein
VTDAGLKHLEGLTRLETLLFAKSKVTDDGARALAQKLPKLKFGE